MIYYMSPRETLQPLFGQHDQSAQHENESVHETLAPFDRKIWHDDIRAQLAMFALNPMQQVEVSGSKTVFVYLAMCTLSPLLYRLEHQPIAAIQILAEMTSGPGANYIVHHAARLRYRSAHLLERDIASLPSFRTAIEDIMIDLDLVTLLTRLLSSDRAAWVRERLSSELMSYSNEEFLRLRQLLSEPHRRPLYDMICGLRDRQGNYTVADLLLLRQGLNDTTPRVRTVSARRIGMYTGLPSLQLVNKLLDMAIHDNDAGPRSAAAYALGKLGDRVVSRSIIESLTEKLTDEDKFVRSATAVVIEKFGHLSATPKIIDHLVTIVLHDDDPYARESAAYALGNMGEAATTPVVLNALTHASQQDDSIDVHDTAISSLIRLKKLQKARTVAQS